MKNDRIGAFRVTIIVASAIALGFVAGAVVYWYWVRPEQAFAPEANPSIEDRK